ncbi:hypothetical protein BDV96DRAFT_581650 [Lophiotrema nucula]|uniref:Uncharacterized protein n=1 Tax=Lophiotrema nucula TaxID=690887 RepID=A0A6A5YXU1_9PLEO|nr:hypothetical protein BDV96DRAFT_581650 [Lophiotrema nucula]
MVPKRTDEPTFGLIRDAVSNGRMQLAPSKTPACCFGGHPCSLDRLSYSFHVRCFVASSYLISRAEQVRQSQLSLARPLQRPHGLAVDPFEQTLPITSAVPLYRYGLARELSRLKWRCAVVMQPLLKRHSSGPSPWAHVLQSPRSDTPACRREM